MSDKTTALQKLADALAEWNDTFHSVYESDAGYHLAEAASEVLANAGLMRAATDLLQALERSLACINEALESGYLPAGTERLLEAMAKDVKAVIAKAEGAARE